MTPSETHCLYGSPKVSRDVQLGPCVKLSSGEDLCTLLPSCGCGGTETVLAQYSRVLSLCEQDGWPKLDRDSTLDLLVLYVLDHAGLLEHGSTIWCSWRTELGDEALAAMRAHWPVTQNAPV